MPSAICSAAEVIAWFAEAQARPTVKAGTVAGMPDPSQRRRWTYAELLAEPGSPATRHTKR